MIKLILAILSTFCLIATSAFALDEETIKFVHSKTHSLIIQKCAKELPGLSQAACACLGDKAEANLDDAVLKNCPDDPKTGTDCIRNAVEAATLKAVAEASMKECLLRK